MQILKNTLLLFNSSPLKIIFSQKGHQRASNAFTKWAFADFVHKEVPASPQSPHPFIDQLLAENNVYG